MCGLVFTRETNVPIMDTFHKNNHGGGGGVHYLKMLYWHVYPKLSKDCIIILSGTPVSPTESFTPVNNIPTTSVTPSRNVPICVHRCHCDCAAAQISCRVSKRPHQSLTSAPNFQYALSFQYVRSSIATAFTLVSDLY